MLVQCLRTGRDKMRSEQAAEAWLDKAISLHDI